MTKTKTFALTSQHFEKKLKKIITHTPQGIEEFGCPCKGCTETRNKITDQIQHLAYEVAVEAVCNLQIKEFVKVYDKKGKSFYRPITNNIKQQLRKAFGVEDDI